MKLYIGDGLYLVSGDDPDRICLMRRENGGPPLPVRPSAKTNHLVAREAIRLARTLHLAGELERLPVGDLYTAETPGTDTAIIRLPGGGYGLHVDGDQQPDLPTATDAARAAYGLPGADTDTVRTS